MAFFSEIVNEARRNAACRPAPATSPKPVPVATASEAPAASDPFPPPVTSPAPEQETKTPAIDLTPAADAADDAAKRKAHEAAEAKRKAEWDAKQAKKKAVRQEQLGRIAAMDDTELVAAAADRIAADTERLTRRNMKEAVAEHIQNKCREDAALARLVMDPAKSMVNCFQYINRKARKYAEQEMKDEGIQRTGTYGCDVPDGLVYQWAEEYFHDENAEEDHKNDEKFIPKPYVPASPDRKKTQGKATKKPVPETKPKVEKPTAIGMEQLSLM